MQDSCVVERFGSLGINVEAMAIEVHSRRIIFREAALLRFEVEIVEVRLGFELKRSE